MLCKQKCMDFTHLIRGTTTGFREDITSLWVISHLWRVLMEGQLSGEKRQVKVERSFWIRLLTVCPNFFLC